MDKFQFANMRVEGIDQDIMENIFDKFYLAVQEAGGNVGGGYKIVKDDNGQKEDRAT